MRENENEARPPTDSQSQEDETELSWIKKITKSVTRIEELEMEAKNGWDSRPKIGVNMKSQDVLNQANVAISENGKTFGDMNIAFTKAAVIASAMLERNVSNYDVAIILQAVSMSRLSFNQSHQGTWIDLAANTGIAAQFASPQMPKAEMPMTAAVENELRNLVTDNTNQ